MTTLSGTEATEQRLETVVPGVAAVHATFSSAHCAGDALRDRSPLSRSAIVLAGANADSRGVWTAEEVVPDAATAELMRRFYKGLRRGATVALFAAAGAAGVRGVRPAHRAAAWMAVLTLATLRSPYAPPYVMSGMLYALLLVSGEVRSRVHIALYVAAWLLFTLPVGVSPDAMWLSLARQLIVLGCLFWMAARRDVEP